MIKIHPQLNIRYVDNCPLCNMEFSDFYYKKCAEKFRTHLINTHNVADNDWAICMVDINKYPDELTESVAKFHHWQKIYDIGYLDNVIEEVKKIVVESSVDYVDCAKARDGSE